MTGQARSDFELVCARVSHEDGLINSRTTWTLVFHGFLFSAYVGGVGLYEKARFELPLGDPVALGLLLVSALGVVSAIAAKIGIRYSERQLVEISRWWNARVSPEMAKHFPPLYDHARRAGGPSASDYYLLLAVVWALLGYLVYASRCVP